MIAKRNLSPHSKPHKAKGDSYSGYGAQWGYISDSAEPLDPLGHRFYDPAEARFVNRDPIGYWGGADLYGYVGDEATGRADPWGLWIVTIGVGGLGILGPVGGGFDGGIQFGTGGFAVSGDTYGGLGWGVLGAVGIGVSADPGGVIHAGRSGNPIVGAVGGVGDEGGVIVEGITDPTAPVSGATIGGSPSGLGPIKLGIGAGAGAIGIVCGQSWSFGVTSDEAGQWWNQYDPFQWLDMSG